MVFGQTDRLLILADGKKVNAIPKEPFWQEKGDHVLGITKSSIIYNGYSAYSDLLLLENGQMACLFECGHISPYDGILFKWLDVSK